MASISELLDKFKDILSKDDIDKDIIIKIFKKVLGKDIQKKDILFKKGILYIKSNVYMKSDIRINKEILLKEIRKENIGKVVNNIQ